ncbi:GNAT family N-acetyltransferase [Cecembia lonarensis]|uniref:Ribosomal-protein-alanine acetyltransferase n=1 Tax=Cecembia lonarensis (strain CCUG 58316 / KCTC 22772 / LW9) TaxID=1225176 RepID=K1L495_CECL9|nr:GNAT family N-acetyltransferase [Cecembia lonarensis]EKB51225.1 ribosomal-protein-alanine acetyltransferase [Cecembia lonarensis LW9]
MKISILTINNLNPTIEAQISQLYKQLGGEKKQVPLKEVLAEDNAIILAYCEHNDQIIGIASMCTYHVISGKKGWIEDVVVDTQYRGQGIGRKLMEKLLEKGKKKKLTEILLFTEAHRIPAINLYADLGFKLKESRIYTLKMP